jgi:hypothetical protein
LECIGISTSASSATSASSDRLPRAIVGLRRNAEILKVY